MDTRYLFFFFYWVELRRGYSASEPLTKKRCTLWVPETSLEQSILLIMHCSTQTFLQ